MYYVLGTSGDKYGPADVATLRQWVVEGRLSPQTMLEDGVTARVFAAQELAGLFDAPPAAPQNLPPGAPSPYSPVSSAPSQPYSPVAGPGQAHSFNTDPKSGLPLQSPYVRYDQTQDFTRNKSIGQAALIMMIISFVCCISGSFWSIGVAVGAVICSHQAKQAGHEKGQLYLTLSIIALVMNVIMFILGIALGMSGFWSRFN